MNRRERRSALKKTKKGRLKASNTSETVARQKFSEAVHAYQSGNLAQATVMVDELIKSLSANADLYKLRGSIELSQQNAALACDYFRKGLSIDPSNAALCDLLGTALSESGELEKAITSFRRALLNDPRNPGTLNNLGLVLLKKGDLEKAIAAFNDSLIYRPEDTSTLLNLANALEEYEKFDDAVTIYRRLIEKDQGFLEAYQALGECQMNARDWNGALQTAEDALAHGLVDAEIYTLKGYALGALLQFSDAEAALQRALEMEPDRASAQTALSILCFYQEKWSDAWSHYEARLRNPTFITRPFPQPRWAGEDLEDKKILVWGEQGVGDEIMFGTMLSDFLKRAPNVTFEMDPRLVPLYARSFPDIECVARIDDPPENLLGDTYDFQTPSGSLGQYLRLNGDCFGSGASYLKPEEAKVETLRQTYEKTGETLNVGLAWYSSHERGRSKSIPLESLEPLFQIPNILFFDLQYGDTQKEQRDFAQKFGHQLYHDETIDQMESIDDFAAQIAAMDLVISISNTTVHISGALGVPTWILLPAAPMQRWLMDRTDSPWYASVELFRQRNDDDLPEIVATVCDRLKKFKP